MDDNSPPLILRHRPTEFAAVRGHSAAVAALERRLANPGHPHSYLLTGPSGVGKTTLARIIGAAVGAEITEVDAATHSGIDAMRALVDFGNYLSPDTVARILIIDECHMLSDSAWKATLKAIEEPPAHLYWAFATTEFDEVPDTVVTRCFHTKLNKLTDREVEEFLVEIVIAEGWDTMHPEVFQLIVREANGSPRMALTLADVLFDAPDPEEASRIIALQGSDEPLRQIMSILVGGRGGWANIQPLLKQIPDADFNRRALIAATRYVCGALDREGNDNRAKRLWECLSCLTYPAHGFDNKALFYAAVGRFLWSPS